MKVKKSVSHAVSRLVPPPPTEVSVEVARECPTHGGEKRLDGGGSELPKKKMKVTVSKTLRRVAPKGTSEKAHRDKGKELAEAIESHNCPPP
ncbi:hypothetical protein B296_00009490 [Ensete ventricosum]|uniref:Uncharacterized protein n=1 Tax=Ensete ventricosum TaxID=4639 RepID=A0A427ARQ7_ENSVE|nr:hypothetical protein B296_00009490 [Ensete ventricosum]